MAWLALIVMVLAVAAGPSRALAQSALAGPPPVRSTIDANGVDLTSGAFTVSAQEVVIGQPDSGGLVYARSFYRNGWRDNYIGTIKSSGTTYTVSMGGGSETFVLSGGVYASDQDVGSSLTYNSGTQVYTYTTGDGTVALFAKSLAESSPLEANEGKVTSVTAPNGTKLTYTYKTVTISSVAYNRLQSVTNNFGYQLKFEYSANTATTTGDLPAFRLMTKVTGLNNAVDYCNPAADSCSFSQTWPYAVYATPGDNSMARTVTDTLSQVTRYSYDSSGRITGLRRPSASSDTTTITYETTYGDVATVSNGSATWSYYFDHDIGGIITTVTDPLSHTRSVTTTNDGLVLGDTDGAGRTTSYQYDGSGRLTRVTSPAGDYVQYAYDARGNVTTTTRVAVSGSGLANIVTSASYDSTCSNPVKCNRPNTTTDATGQVTNYTYDATHGGVLTVTLPAPVTSGTRPQTRITYSSLYAYHKNSGGSIVAAASPVYLPTATSACVSSSSCAGTSTEVKTTVTYGSTGVANNLLPTSATTGAGDGSLMATTAMTWDSVGNKLTVDGPLSGSDDTTRYRYDAGRRLVGVVGPDPDGAGTLKFRAARATYNADSQPTVLENGTVTAQSDTAWSSMTVLQQANSTYDGLGRLTKRTLVTGGSTQAVVQYSYDAANRLDCTAVRMNPSVFGSPPSSACTLGTTGSNGPDRITRNTYSAADQIIKVTSAYGVSGQAADDVTLTYNSWGQVATAADAMGGLTTYEYDGFGRAKKMRYPMAGTRTSSSTTDYEEVTFDAYGRVSQERRRDGSMFGASYDLLSRPTTLDAPTGMNDNTYTYDLLGRTLTVAYTGHTITYVWDALGRLTSATGPLGTIGYQYDLAGRRTRITWPDSYYATYDYDLAGEVTAVRENGATSGAGVLATYAYDDLGQRTSLTRGNGVVTSWTFDSASRLTSLTNDLAGTGGDQTWSFTYAASFQALTRTGTNSAYAPAIPANVNRTYTSNGLNQLTASGALSLSYNGNGNLTSDGVNSYTYDAASRLTGMSGVTLAYDPLGRLYQTAGSATTRFAYDGAELVGEFNTSGTLLRRYVHGPGMDEPLVWYEGSGTTDRRWLVTDQLGSVVAVTNGSGTSTATNTYDEYGVPGASNSGRFQYTGQTWVSEIGLYNYKARLYSPTLGRFMQPDPSGYGDGMNMYAYAWIDPVNAIDPSGLAACDTDNPARPPPSPTTTANATTVGCLTVTASICTRGWICGEHLTGYIPPDFGIDVEVKLVTISTGGGGIGGAPGRFAKAACEALIDSGGDPNQALATLLGTGVGALAGKYLGDVMDNTVTRIFSKAGRELGDASKIVGAGARGAARGARVGRAMGYAGVLAGVAVGIKYRTEIETAIRVAKEAGCGRLSK